MELTKRQQDMVDAAISIIAKRGYKDLTTKNLAEAIGITEAALYRHFGSKADLVNAILDYFGHIAANVLKDIQAEMVSPFCKVEMFVMNRFRIFQSNPDLGSVMFSEELFISDKEHGEHMRSIMHSHRHVVEGYIVEAMRSREIRNDVDAQQLFRVIIGSMRFLVMQWNISNHGFDLVEEGTKMMNTIKKLIEVNK